MYSVATVGVKLKVRVPECPLLQDAAGKATKLSFLPREGRACPLDMLFGRHALYRRGSREKSSRSRVGTRTQALFSSVGAAWLEAARRHDAQHPWRKYG